VECIAGGSCYQKFCGPFSQYRGLSAYVSKVMTCLLT
jgi:hypothetical protein